MSERQIGVFGANGHTGRFVAAELLRRGVMPILIGRDRGALDELRDQLGAGEVRVASIHDQTSLGLAFAGLDAVINCAGPFLDTARPVARAALRAGCHLLDVCAEQATALDMFETFDGPAKSAGRVVVPAMAFFGGLADLLATLCIGDWPDAESIDIAVALDSWHPTAGTRITGERNLVPRQIIRNGRLTIIPSPPPTTVWQFPSPFGEQAVTCAAVTEIITISRHISARSVTSFMTLQPLADLADEATPPPRASDSSGRSDQLFAMAVSATRGDERRDVVACGRDIYAITAPLVVEACLRIIDTATPSWSGVRAPGEIFEPRAFFSALSDVLWIAQSSAASSPAVAPQQ